MNLLLKNAETMGITVRIIKVRYDTVRRVCSIRGNGGKWRRFGNFGLDGGGGFRLGDGWRCSEEWLG